MGDVAPAAPVGRRPNPRIQQYKRTWYFLRRNTLSLLGLGIIVALIVVALYATTTPIPWDAMVLCGGSNNQPVTFQESGLPAATDWSVRVFITGTTGTEMTSNTTNITFSEPSGPIYNFTVAPVTGYNVTPAAGVFPVAGVAVLEMVKFTPTSDPATAISSPGASPAATASSTVCSVCTYPVGTPDPGPNCYQTPKENPGVVAPTLSLNPVRAGPLPLGSLSLAPNTAYFYNIYNGLLRGSDYSLLISFSIVLVGAMAGLIVGAISGFFGGVVDETLMRLVDILLSIPQILFVIIVIAVITSDYQTLFGLSPLDTRIFLLIIGFTIVWWPYYARIVRGQVLVVREQKYVEAARASGAGKGRIVLRHIVPNSMYPVFIQMSLDVGSIPLLVGGLGFLGFRLFTSPYFPEWGTIAAWGANSIITSFLLECQTGICVVPWWQLFFPGLALFLFAISVNFFSDGLRDALDPRLRR